MKNYLRIDVANKQIVMDKTFQKNSQFVGSPEYNQLQTARRDYPNYSVVRKQNKKNVAQEHYKGLTYEYMEWYITKYEHKEDRDNVLDFFAHFKDIAQGHSRKNRYQVIKKWFLNEYPDFANGIPQAIKEGIITADFEGKEVA